MMRSLYSGVAGLKSHQTGMDVIGNNIANINTTGFKSYRTTFADTLYQTSKGASAPQGNQGGVNPLQIGLGVGVASVDKIFTNGSVQTTSSNTDLCLSGDALFIVKDGSGVYYTRNGAFRFDGEGNYVNAAGQFVQGWMATDGVLNTNGLAGDINIPSGKPMAPTATSNATYRNNLNAADPTILSITDQDGETYPSGAGNANTAAIGQTTNQLGNTVTSLTIRMSDGTTQILTSGIYTQGHSLPVTTTLTIYDSLGNAHTVALQMEKTGANTDQWQVSLANTTILEPDGSTTTLTLTPGNFNTNNPNPNYAIKFNTNGSYDTVNSQSGSLTLTYNNGSTAPQTVSIDTSSLTQYAGSNTVTGSANGNAPGTLVELNVDSTGTITGTYTNGINQIEAQVALAQFNNAAGLTAHGSSLFTVSNNSGDPNVKTATDFGVTITPSALEMSNVDLANEFSTMIVTQRGFQSNSKIITVSDEMLETIVNMKR